MSKRHRKNKLFLSPESEASPEGLEMGYAISNGPIDSGKGLRGKDKAKARRAARKTAYYDD